MPKPEDIAIGRRQELINAALHLFLAVGYDKTTIRGILKEVDGEVGMFYHHFASKNEIYKAALEQYNSNYIKKMTDIFLNEGVSLGEKLDKIFSVLVSSLSEYRSMYTEKLNTDVRGGLLADTLVKLIPLMEKLIEQGIAKKIIPSDVVGDIHATSRFILFGTSGVIHSNQGGSMEDRIQACKNMIFKVLDIDIKE